MNDAYTTPPTQADPKLLAEFNAGVQRAREATPLEGPRTPDARPCVQCGGLSAYRTCKACIARARRARAKESK